MPDDALDTLCASIGIERSYTDQSGDRHDVPIETIEALSGVLGFGGAARTAQASSLLEPVVVWRSEEGPPIVSLNLPGMSHDASIAWQLTEENGAIHEGETAIEQHRLRLPVALPLGYHRLRARLIGRDAAADEMLLIVAPSRAYLPAELEEGSVWGVAVQLYALRSPYDWGIGDFGDLNEFVRRAAAAGASAVGLNPLHALFVDEPERASPYSPSSRVFINPLYIDVEAVPDYAECPAAHAHVAAEDFQAGLRALRQAPLVDYPGVARHKRAVLELLYDSFRRNHLAALSPRGRKFRAFQRRQGPALRRFSLFQVLRETLAERDLAQRYWPNWPIAYRDPRSAAVKRFAVQHLVRLEFFEYLQWQAQEQLAHCAATARVGGMPVGLYRDMAVGVDAGAAEAWSRQDMFAGGWSIGAPPDLWSPRGQDWGLSPINPLALRRAQYQPFIDLVRANMRGSGALRIDHILGLWRTFWIRHGDAPVKGAYVRYPFADLVGILALESHREKCVVIGEDLGTVPEGLRAELERAAILGCRLLYFEQDAEARFIRPEDYPRSALVAVGSHDLPTLPGYWCGADIELRGKLGFFADETQVESERHKRLITRETLRAALRDAGMAEDNDERPPVDAAYRFLARAPSRILMVQIEDPLDIVEQINVPGTVDQHPNWRRRLPLSIAAIFRDVRVSSLFDALNRERPRARGTSVSDRITKQGVPVSTYRLQFGPRFALKDALALIPYLSQLGVSHVYTSPLLTSRPGSEHGYDITDHNTLNPELGGWEDFVRFSDALRARGMGLILDFVPNHMGIGHADNAWWLDVLEWGENSIYSGFFDIDWSPYKSGLRGKVLLPILGDHYGQILERNELTLRFSTEDGSLSVWYHTHRLPLSPRSYAAVIRRHSGRPELMADGMADLAEDERARLDRIAKDFDRIRHVTARRRDETRQVAAGLKAELAELCRASPAVARVMTAAAADFGGTPGKPESFRLLHTLLERQHYRLAFWRVAADEVNYRRFFDISDLAGIRMENAGLFAIAHELVGRMIEEGRLQGLRLDHVDGLFDPETYFQRLQAFAQARRPGHGPGHGTDGKEPAPFYVIAEKILAQHESLRGNWPIAGTTGYDFVVLVNGLFIDPAGEQACNGAYRAFCGALPSFDEIVIAAKGVVIENLLSGELTVLANELDRISERHWSTRDYTWQRLRDALKEVVRHFPVYRTYVTSRRVAAEDRRDLEWAVQRARRSWRGGDGEILDFVYEALTGDLIRRGPAFRRAEVFRFAMRFQQYTGPITAKSFEDTAFYRYHRLISLNEVGGDPRQFGVSVAAFHQANRKRAQHWPHTMLAGSTHDTKRGEDARTRIDVLSELQVQWDGRAARWAELNQSHRAGQSHLQDGGDQLAPSREDEYLIYQTLLGAWPAELIGVEPRPELLAPFLKRVEGYLVKAVREAKLRTSWANPSEAYESACIAFLRGALDASRPNPFLREFVSFAGRIAYFGMLNSLSQVTLRLAVPGVPDIYQGSELWDLSLVDPDNRQPVDFEQRMHRLREMSEIEAGSGTNAAILADALARWPDGGIKLRLTRCILGLRRESPDLFRDGAYDAIVSEGAHADRLIAFVRHHRDQRVLVLVGRLFAGLLGFEVGSYNAAAWGDCAALLPSDLGGRWRDVLRDTTRVIPAGGEPSRVRAAELLADAPVAVLVRERN